MANERIFISYARKDGMEFAAKLRDKIASEGHSIWQDLIALRGGAHWWSQIEAAMRDPALDHFVLVVTPGSLASDIVRKEFRLAQREGKSILPVRGPGLISLSEVPRWVGHVYDLDIPEQSALYFAHLREPSRRNRKPMMAPEPPEDFVARPREFDPLKAQLLAPSTGPVAITAALRGAGGYGKTTLAQALAHDDDIQDEYCDGILWVELGEKPQELRAQLSDLVTRLTGSPPQLETIAAASSALADALGDRRILIVIDDVWREQDLRPFLHGGPRTTRLVTTRIDSTAPANAFRQKVDALEADQALHLISIGFDGKEVQPLSTELRALAMRLGRWPLMLKLVNGFLRQRVSKLSEPLAAALVGVDKRLTAKGLVAFDPKNEAERNQAVSQTIGVSLDMLDKSSQERFLELAIFLEDNDIPLSLVQMLWSSTGGLNEFETEDLAAHLEGLSLLLNLDLSTRTLRLHDTIRDFLRVRLGEESLKSLSARVTKIFEPALKLPGRSRYFALIQILVTAAQNGDHQTIGKLQGEYEWVREFMERLQKAYAAFEKGGGVEKPRDEP